MSRIRRSDAAQPDLRIGKAVSKSVARSHFAWVDFVVTSLNVDRNKIAQFAPLDTCANLFLEDRFAALAEFLFAVTWSAGCRHDGAPNRVLSLLYPGWCDHTGIAALILD